MVSQDLLVSGQDLKSIVSSDQYAWGDLEISWEMVQAKFDGITFQQIKEPIEFPLYLLCKIQWQTKHRECTVVRSGHLQGRTETPPGPRARSLNGPPSQDCRNFFIIYMELSRKGSWIRGISRNFGRGRVRTYEK